jgi:DNA-binding transcriptional LysR family regulator
MGEPLFLPSLESVRSIIEEQLTQAGVSAAPAMVLNRLDTTVVMGEAGQGIGIVPASAQPGCQHRRVVVSRLTNPTVPIDIYLIRNRCRKPSSAPFTMVMRDELCDGSPELSLALLRARRVTIGSAE